MTPSSPSPSGARLAVVLQELRKRTGLTLAQLANATTFSKSSWERYLNGKGLPPRSAVKELCHLAGEPADRPLALLDIARTDRTQDSGARVTPDRQRTGHRTDTPASDLAPADPVRSETARDGIGPARTRLPDDGPSETGLGKVDHTPSDPRKHRRLTVLTSLAAVCAVVLAALVIVHLPDSHAELASPGGTPPTATGALCRHTACQDKDPITTKCAANPLTLTEHETDTGAWIQIRYSQECGTSWARMWGAVVGDRIEVRATGRKDSLRGVRVNSSDEADTYVHTSMSVVVPGTSVQACFVPGAGGATECFKTRTDKTLVAP
ncbi:DUF2690 domain-containing protein [Streptomyces sp. NPDC005301]|uniref:helix-turn-helix domain-containing protein n=1 Tax=Streptomyces sp. NPDC005301 TaxID=3156874 RepID=UPI00339DE579